MAVGVGLLPPAVPLTVIVVSGLAFLIAGTIMFVRRERNK